MASSQSTNPLLGPDGVADPYPVLSRAYLGRVESKYERLEQGQNIDQGHQQQIAGLGNSFRKASGLQPYQQTDPTGKN